MRIEYGLPKKQKAQGGRSAKGLISIRLEVIGLCRRHHNPLTKAPVRTGILTGAVIRATEAAQTLQSDYQAFGSRDQGRSRAMPGGRRCASVIPVDSIIGSVHLIPRFGPVTPREWNSFSVLELCNTFYVNPFSSRDNYLRFE